MTSQDLVVKSSKQKFLVFFTRLPNKEFSLRDQVTFPPLIDPRIAEVAIPELPPALAPAADPTLAVGVFLDFDGTLSHIVPQPEKARPIEGTAQLLEKLASCFERVGVVSGRPAGWILRALGWERPPQGLWISGLYGMERIGPDGSLPAKRIPALDQAASTLSSLTNESPHGKLLLEDKGASVTLHWRQAPLAEPFARQLLEEISRHYGLELRWGKSCGELMPKDSPDKGQALAELAQGTQVLIYAGDDLGDLAAFRAMDEMGPRLSATCKIAVDSPEAPAELLAEADLVVEGPVGLKRVLDALRKTRCPQG